MEPLEIISTSHKIDIEIDPTSADIAIVSIDNQGTLGMLNSLVLTAYGYSETNLPTESQLKDGFSQLSSNDRKTIIFVVTLNNETGSTSKNLRDNFLTALQHFKSLIEGKKVWIPLMGTGAAGLGLVESYSITASVINIFSRTNSSASTFLISVPESRVGRAIVQEVGSFETNSLYEAKNFVDNLKSKLYLVGSLWGRDDQLERFIKSEIWEKGQDDESYSDLINKVEKDDVLIIKSSFASSANSVSYLRIKALGLVKSNPQDGSKLMVDWRISKISLDIENLGFYRSTIAEVSPPDAVTIISKIDKQLWGYLLVDQKFYAKKERVAGILSDSDSGVDYLNISADVNAFAKVIAARAFEPPLAVALFGQWGSGKSFFMKKLKEKILELSNTNAAYCEGIVHIHFNAWSYMDSNLWASIVTRIFEHLEEYISENTNTVKEKNEIHRQLTSELTIAKEEVGVLEFRKKVEIGLIKALSAKRDELNKEIDDKIDKLRKDTLWEVIKKVDDEFDAKEKISNSISANKSYIKSTDQLREIVPEKYWKDPTMAYEMAKSKYTFLKSFFRKDKVAWNFIILICILITISLLPYLIGLLSSKIESSSFIIPQVVLCFLASGKIFWQRATDVYTHLQPVVASFWEIKENYDKRVQEATSNFQQEEKVLKLEIEKSEAELLLVNDQIQKSESVKADLQFRIDNALATEALYSFIDRRSKSEDYKKHLGLISIVRKDFEVLNNLFIEHNQEAGNKKNYQEFRQKFKKPLERIILYIDDLDRCPTENVVQVLEAVNLLMAFPLFVVVVGVDYRWIKNALVTKHSVHFSSQTEGNRKNNDMLELINPAGYLEKIFQIPFHLQNSEDGVVKYMIKSLAEGKNNVESNLMAVEDANTNNVLSDKPGTDSEILVESNNEKLVTSNSIIPIESEALIFSEEEIGLMQAMSVLVGASPRSVKRFVNIYRIVKVHEGFTSEAQIIKQERAVVLFLLALPLGRYRTLLPSLKKFMFEGVGSFSTYSIFNHPDEEINRLKGEIGFILSKNEDSRVLDDASAELFAKHYDFLSRFSFEHL